MTRLTRKLFVLIAIVAGIPLLLLGALGLLHMPAGERWLETLLNGWLSSPERSVVINDLRMRWPLHLRAERIEVSDRAGPWLVLSRSALDWRPDRLLAGVVAVEQLTVERAELRRKPLATPSEGPPSLPRLPLAIHIDQVAAGVSIAATVTGSPLDLLASGHAVAGPNRLDVGLDLRRQGARQTEAHVRASYDQASLGVDVTVTRPVADVLVGLGGIAGQVPAMDLTLTGQGPLSDWRGTVTGTIDGRSCLDGTLRLARTEGLEVTADLGQAPECLPDPVMARLLAGAPIALRANVTFENGRLTRIAEARLRSAAVRIGISGTLENRLGVRFSLETGELDRFGALAGIDAGGSLQASGTVTGSLAEPVLEARLLSAGGHVGTTRWSDLATDVQLNPTADGGGWMAGTTGSAVPVGLPLGDRPMTWSSTVHFNRADDLYRLVDLRVTGPGGQSSLFGTVRADGMVALRGLIRSERLSLFRDLSGLPRLDGRAVAHVAVSGNAHDAIATTVFAATSGFATGQERVDPLLGSAPRLTATAIYRQGTMPLVHGMLSGDKARLAFGGKAFPGLGLGWHLALPDLAALGVAEVSGQGEAYGLITGPIALPHLAGLLRGQVTRSEQTLAILGAVGVSNLAAPAGAIHLGVRDDQLTADLSSRFRVANGLNLGDIALVSRDTRLTGDIAISDGGVSGHLTGRSSDLQPWSQLAGVMLSGSLTVDAKLSHSKYQEIDANLSGTGLTLARLRIGQLGGKLTVSDPLGKPRGTGRLDASQVAVGGTALRSVEVRAEGSGETIDLRVAVAGPGDRRSSSSLTAQGTLRLQDDAQTLRLASLALSGGGVSGRLMAPTTVVHTDDSIRIAPTRLDIGGGRVELSGQVSGQGLDLRLALTNAPVKLIEPYLTEDQRLVGTLNATALVTGTVAAPVVAMESRGQGLGLVGAGRERLDLTAKARWQDRQVAFDARIKGTRGSSVSVDGRLPLLADFSIPDNGSISGHLRGSGDLDRLTAALPFPGHRIAGKLDADVSVAGTVAQPAVTGQARLREGFYEFYETGTRLRDIQATLTARDSRNFALTLSGSDERRKGRLSGDGRVELRGTQPAWDLAVTLSDFGLIEQDAARARASAQLSFTGQGDSGRLAGKVQIGPGEYHITEGLGGGTPKLRVTEINRPGSKPVVKVTKPAPDVNREKPDQTGPANIALAIEVEIDRMFVRGQGLESDWQGHLTVGGTARDPSVSGQLEAVHGAYDFIGKRFELIDSKVTLDGGAKIDPILDVTAEATANDITAQVKVGGTASKPDLQFTSVPTLPSDEILSRLLFGKSVGQLSVAQQVQIARAAASLTGKGQYDPIGLLRGQMGLDLLDIGVSEEGGGVSPNVTVGKYLDRDTFLRVEEGLGSNEEKISIERRIGQGLSVEADVGRRGSGGVGLSWRKDY